ncbi:RING-type E3 ubiquitin transferase [Malassezia yamatoensis]|uniref:RING-type E3 ubiquitin transferase n=1 Tax=Malassezia yamatoensis TaxID=253288 RepID=A0AAJ6CG64_9BASI|nr:RING-type E3 ubiquitin transferase [Malassezia yamatoensis]
MLRRIGVLGTDPTLRELQVWPHLDIAFLSFYIPALLSYVDIRSEVVMDRLTEWIGSTDDAAQLIHEMELFIRSGRGGLGLEQYDTCPWLQYDDAM